MDKQQAAEHCARIYHDAGYTGEGMYNLAIKCFHNGWEACEAQSPTDAVAFLEWANEKHYVRLPNGRWCLITELCDDGIEDRGLTTTELYKLFNPSGAAPANYKDAIRKMMEETNGDLIVHIPEVSGTGRAKAQVIVMDEFFKTFPPGADLEQLRKDYNEIKPSV